MKQYLDLLQHVLNNGKDKSDRTGTGTRSVFGYQMRFNLQDGFPLVTTKHCSLKAIIHELLWFLAGDTNVKYLQDNGVKIWNEWCIPTTIDVLATNEEIWNSIIEKGCMEEYEKFIVSNGPVSDEAMYKWCEEHDVSIIKTILNPDPNVGELGPIYGHQWRNWVSTKFIDSNDIETIVKLKNQGYKYFDSLTGDGTIIDIYEKRDDQISTVIKELQTNPDSRRMIVSAWNVSDLPDMALAPCHTMFQFYTEELTFEERFTYSINNFEQYNRRGYTKEDIEEATDWMNDLGIPTRKLSCQLFQRSCDSFLGLPFNIASYSLLTMMIAQVVNMVPGEFIHTFGDLHIYSNHMDQVKLQLTREPKQLPVMKINPKVRNIFDFKYEDFTLEGYDPHPSIKAPVAV